MTAALPPAELARHENRPYDQLVRQLIDSTGVWTTHPEVNFVTATVEPEKGPAKNKLAARVSRAFLGVRIQRAFGKRAVHPSLMCRPWCNSMGFGCACRPRQLLSNWINAGASARVWLGECQPPSGVAETGKISHEGDETLH